MRLFAFHLAIFLVLASAAEAKILTDAPSCQTIFAKMARFLSGPPKGPDDLPFDVAALEKAIHPDLMLEDHDGMVNAGLWHYSENGRRYFVKSLGAKGWANEAEIENAKAMADMGIGPKVHAFKDDVGVDYLIFDHVPGINAKGLRGTGKGIEGPVEAPFEVRAEMRRALQLPADANWWDVQNEYLAELYKRRFEAAKKLKEIRKTLFAHDYYRLQDFQFMIYFEKGEPGVRIEVIDSAYFTRGKPRDESEALTGPIDRWIRAFEKWQIPEGNSAVEQLENMIEPNPLPAAHH
jgi:hypothetical protein